MEKNGMTRWLWVIGLVVAVLLPLIGLFVSLPFVVPVLIVAVIGLVLGALMNTKDKSALLLKAVFLVVLGSFSFAGAFAGIEVVGEILVTILSGLSVLFVFSAIAAVIKSAVTN